MNKYEKIIYWSDEDNSFIVEVPQLPGCVAHGNSENEAINNVNDAIELWLEVARSEKKHIPIAKGRRLIYA